jgi:hypothetical protein
LQAREEWEAERAELEAGAIEAEQASRVLKVRPQQLILCGYY